MLNVANKVHDLTNKSIFFVVKQNIIVIDMLKWPNIFFYHCVYIWELMLIIKM